MPSPTRSSTGSPAAGSGAGPPASQSSDPIPNASSDLDAEIAGGQERLPGEPDPRVTLALERTFLAWIRTALALIAGGLAISQLAKPSSETITLVSSLALISFGAVISVVGYRHWKRNERALRLGKGLERSTLPGFLIQGIGWFAVAAAVLAILRFTS